MCLFCKNQDQNEIVTDRDHCLYLESWKCGMALCIIQPVCRSFSQRIVWLLWWSIAPEGTCWNMWSREMVCQRPAAGELAKFGNALHFLRISCRGNAMHTFVQRNNEKSNFLWAWGVSLRGHIGGIHHESSSHAWGLKMPLAAYMPRRLDSEVNILPTHFVVKAFSAGIDIVPKVYLMPASANHEKQGLSRGTDLVLACRWFFQQLVLAVDYLHKMVHTWFHSLQLSPHNSCIWCHCFEISPQYNFHYPNHLFNLVHNYFYFKIARFLVVGPAHSLYACIFYSVPPKKRPDWLAHKTELLTLGGHATNGWPGSGKEAFPLGRLLNLIWSYSIMQGFASRDIKLDNVLLDKSRKPLLKLCDFGYSKVSRMTNYMDSLYPRHSSPNWCPRLRP